MKTKLWPKKHDTNKVILKGNNLKKELNYHLGIKHNCNYVVLGLSIIFFNQINNFLMRSMVSMRHIQSGNIHPSLSQLPNHFPGVGRRTNGANNLCLPPKRGFWPHSNRSVAKLLHTTQVLQLFLNLFSTSRKGLQLTPIFSTSSIYFMENPFGTNLVCHISFNKKFAFQKKIMENPQHTLLPLPSHLHTIFFLSLSSFYITSHLSLSVPNFFSSYLSLLSTQFTPKVYVYHYSTSILGWVMMYATYILHTPD